MTHVPFSDGVRRSHDWANVEIVIVCWCILSSCPANARKHPVIHADGYPETVFRKHVVFGKVVEGLNILKKIEAVPTSGPPRNKPNVPVKILDCGEVILGKENGVGSVKDGKLQTMYGFAESVGGHFWDTWVIYFTTTVVYFVCNTLEMHMDRVSCAYLIFLD